MQGLMLLAIGFGALQRNVDVLINGVGGFAVTFAPAVFERDYTVPMDSRLTLWLTGAVFLHVVGAVGFPGVPGNFYSNLWWWDHLTHAASATLVAGIGYAMLRAVDEHTDSVRLPPKLTVILTVLVVLAVGVYWEVFEYMLGHVRIGGESALDQYGAGDTLKDLAFDTAGGMIAAVVGGLFLWEQGD